MLNSYSGNLRREGADGSVCSRARHPTADAERGTREARPSGQRQGTGTGAAHSGTEVLTYYRKAAREVSLHSPLRAAELWRKIASFEVL